MSRLHATHVGELELGGKVVPCAVLSNALRVLHARPLAIALGRGKESQNSRSAKLAPFVGAANLKPFVTRHLKGPPNSLEFTMPSGQSARGWDALLLLDICEVYLDARDAGVLRKNQLHVAQRCERIMRGIARIGIVALIDEASGFQEERDATALQRLLRFYIRPELGPHETMYPEELFREIYRLHGWTWKGNGRHPQCVGAMLNWLFYDRMIPGLRPELCRLNPINEHGRRAHRHHQYLTDDTGRAVLAQMIAIVLAQAKTARSWESFKRNVDIVLPREGKQPSAVRAAIAEQLWLAGMEPTGIAAVEGANVGNFAKGGRQ